MQCNIGEHESPWLVRLLNLRSDAECVGTLISPDFVLTSGFCCAQKCKNDVTCEGQNIVAAFAAFDMAGDGNQKSGGSSGYETVASAFLHPMYNAWTFQHDICLLKLQNEVNFRAEFEN